MVKNLHLTCTNANTNANIAESTKQKHTKKRQLRKEVALSGLFDKNYQFFSATGVTET